ncbi:hypothetical protein PGTUg99_024702 [Puccinia graminis f. sp. tritici]|uniref:Uncharacterized protein n=1 Tax=Puccinia graminis f. sp. tritici TaxID=56615 RepID=A0A5B0PLC5_PUCGR|nr:hypothetical protein PGTUg99_024702 [Puccinia graminis f. sp. tritici]
MARIDLTTMQHLRGSTSVTLRRARLLLDSSSLSSSQTVAVVGLIFVLAIKSSGKMLIVCLTLLVNSATPLTSTFGSLNGLAQSCSEPVRTFAPFITGTIFSSSIKQQYLRGNLTWLFGLFVNKIHSSSPISFLFKNPSKNQFFVQESDLIDLLFARSTVTHLGSYLV